ncbi:AAA family ATPase [Biostraticola tofi]|uniref:RecF/RecN/SMC family protein n=1 Tax=Biostraticola tofi TaxID=466109 RepID=A0A4R3YJN7_9GAMM|nr:AAA family ATPase [Biostraticola tofi]TCV91214.1 RecF/RecN/SMC family protein [Biostraticola tofi]
MPGRQNNQIQLRLKKIVIDNLKGISGCEIEFPLDKKITAIMGINGSGKSTIIHALACCYRPKNNTSKDNNKFSDFFTPHVDNNWQGSGFTVFFYKGTVGNERAKITFTALPDIPDNSHIYEQEYSKVKRWIPVYERRPVKESIYLGLQNLGTLSDDLSASRSAKYTSTTFIPEALKTKILASMSRIMEADYTDLMLCTTVRGNRSFIKVTKNGVTYTEHTMGAGEKRVYEVIKAAHDTQLYPNGILLIDELDVLLHEKAFKKIVEELIDIANKNMLEIIFSTHRESIIKFKRAINIVSIFNLGTGIQAYPGVSADALRQLSDIQPEMVSVFVEDELARTAINVLLEREALSDIVNVALFGAAENSAVVLSGLLLSGKNIDNVMGVTDGDVYETLEKRDVMVKKIFSGLGDAVQKQKVLSRIFQFNLTHLGLKGAPEFNHKTWFEEINSENVSDAEKTEFVKLKHYSTSINGLQDWHDYYDQINALARKPSIEHTILSFISKYSPEWDNYIGEVRNEIQARAQELR